MSRAYVTNNEARALGVPSYRSFSLEELEAATNNFEQSSFMGEESHGQRSKHLLKRELDECEETILHDVKILKRRYGGSKTGGSLWRARHLRGTVCPTINSMMCYCKGFLQITFVEVESGTF